MPRRCVVKGCCSRERPGVTLLSLKSQISIRNGWASAIGLGINKKILNNWRICPDHFAPESWEKVREDGTRKLKISAVPTLGISDNCGSENAFTLFPLPRRTSTTPLGDVTNTQQSARRSISVTATGHCGPPRPNCKLNDVADILLTLSEAPRIFPETPEFLMSPLESESTGGHSQKEEEDYSSGNVTLTDEMLLQAEENQISSDNLMVRGPTTAFDHPYSRPNNGGDGSFSEATPAACGGRQTNTSALELERSLDVDEAVAISSCDTEAVEEVTNSSPLDTLRKLSKQELIDLLCKKEKELEEERSKNRRYHQKAESMLKANNQMKRTNIVYRKKIKRLADSRIGHLINVRSRLNKDQITSLCRKSSQGMKWQMATIRDAIVLKMKMGTRAYSDLVKKVPIYPSARTLQKAVEHMDFEPGVLYDGFEALKEDIAKLPPEQRLCVIGGDEMAIEEAEVYDPGSKKMIGRATFGPHGGLAKKAFALVLGGVARRYRITGGYSFTSNLDETNKRKRKENENPVGEAMKFMLLECITVAETIAGLSCEAYVSDMGPDNLALWRAFGIGWTGTARESVSVSIPHPCRPGARFWFLPDTVQLYKNIVTSLSHNLVFILSEDVVRAEGLSTGEVKLEHLQQLLDFEKSFELKIAHRLKQENLDCKKTFAKMRVSNPAAVFCKRTEAGLRGKAALENTSTYDATIFFVSLISRWFALVTNRAGKLALRPYKKEKNRSEDQEASTPKERCQEDRCQEKRGQEKQEDQGEDEFREEYLQAIEFLKKVARVFRSMKIGKDGKWKPIQTEVVMATEALLQIQEDLLVKRKILTFLLLGRFTQDFIENLFSLIRFRLAVPNALHFKHNLRVVTLAQICLTANNTNYFRDTQEDVMLSSDFIAASKKVATARNEERAVKKLMEGSSIEVPEVSDADLFEMDGWEWMVLYNMAGSVLRSLKKMKIKTCDQCFNSLMWHEETSHPCSAFLELTEFKEGAMYAVSDPCFKATMKAEITFRRLRETLKAVEHVDVVPFLVDSLMYVWEGADVPQCHDVTTKYLTRFITMRFQTYGLLRRQEIKATSERKYGSKTVSMHSSVQ